MGYHVETGYFGKIRARFFSLENFKIRIRSYDILDPQLWYWVSQKTCRYITHTPLYPEKIYLDESLVPDTTRYFIC